MEDLREMMSKEKSLRKVNLKVFKQFLLSKEKQILLVGIKEGHLEGLLGEGQIQIDGGSN